MTKLKPCPFCGCKAELREHVFHNLPSTFSVSCNVCGAGIKPFHNTKEQAIEAWNRRVKWERQ